jgi:hypothetical protein
MLRQEGNRKMLNMRTSHEDGTKIFQIISKASAVSAEYGIPLDRMQHAISLTACHANGCPLIWTGC